MQTVTPVLELFRQPKLKLSTDRVVTPLPRQPLATTILLSVLNLPALGAQVSGILWGWLTSLA